ncbi:PX domain-containing protein kinase-like protein [Chironomus tepperi]|uniref:PX domain-containing protein kinase-like protein n=1 Tax=Chironomus tepperi TaxID=113505 RepID=UPI00391F8D95
MNTILASSLPTKKFIDPDSISIPFHEIAHQNVTALLKNENNWVLKNSLNSIGWRARKHYFKVVQKPHACQKHGHLSKLESQGSTSSYKENSSDNEYLLTWTEFGQDKCINDKELNNILKDLASIKHPLIYPIEYIKCNENGCLVIMKFNKEGSLKDLLCGSQPLNSFSTKYGTTKGRNQLPIKDVALYSRHILEGIKYLNSFGLAYGHLTTANIFIHNGIAKLSAIENFLLGVPSFYRPFIVQNSKITTMEQVDLFTFGHVVFEMQSTYSLQEPFVREITDCPVALKSFLEMLITKESLKTSFTIEQLLTHKYFFEFATQKSIDAIQENLKKEISIAEISGKNSIHNAIQKFESRLKDEQKLVKSQKRVVRVQEMMTSEEKKQTKQKLKSQASLQNGPINFKLSLSESDNAGESSSPMKDSH